MKIIVEGHRYELDAFDHPDTAPRQVLQFVQKELQDGQFVTVTPGTTNEEVLAVLIDRIETLDKKNPCPENKLALQKLSGALAALYLRTTNRKARGVEGTPQA